MRENSGVVSALKRLGVTHRQIPYVPQMETVDCGPACLTMVLHYYGNHVSLEQVRVLAGGGRGSDALGLLRAAEQFGLRGRGLKVQVKDLYNLRPGAILHWDFQHFVVFERVTKKGVDIIDPAFGRRRLPLDQVRRHFTGVVLTFEKSEKFLATPAGRSKVWRYLGQLFRNRPLITRLVVTSIVIRVLALALPILTAMIIDRVIPRGDHDLLIVIALGIGVVLIFSALSSFIRSHLLIELRTTLDTKMTTGFVAHLLSLPLSYFNRRTAGDLLMRVSSNTQIRELLTSSLLSALLDGGFAIAYLGLLFLLSPMLATISLVIGLMQIGVLLLARRRYTELSAQDLESQAKAQAYLVQMLVGVETLKVAGVEDKALAHWANLYVDELNIALSRSRLQALIDVANDLLQSAAPLILLGSGAVLVIGSGASLGLVLAGLALAASFLTPISGLVQSMLHLQLLGGYIERIDEVLVAQPERTMEGPMPVLTGGIDLEQVSFRYSANDPLVVRDVSLRIVTGQMVALVGRSGSGKSTFAALLAGLHIPTEGRIYYGGTIASEQGERAYEASELDPRHLRRQLGMVPQNPFVFAGTIRHNIALADPSLSLERVMRAAQKAYIDEDVSKMPMRYDTVVAEGGATLSGGQCQRIALARALINDPAVLLLDEATSSLDATTEKLVMDNLAKLQVTRIVIAHRLSTVIAADQIFVMQEGAIVEQGTHAELLHKRGAYAALIADQAFSAAGQR